MRKIIAAAFLVFVALRASATSVDPVSVESLLRDSEVVVLGQIISGHMLPNNCGIEITIRVNDSIKGHYVQGDILAASIFQEQADIASERIFFISKTPELVTGMASSNSQDMSLMHKRWLRCKDIYPAYGVDLAGMAAPPVIGTYLEDAKQVVELNDFVMSPPPGIPSRKEERFKSYGFDRYTDHVWVERSQFMEYLRSLPRGK